MFDFTGKKVLVTGAGRGIGRGIALALVEAGCKVYALDCVQETLDTLAAENANIVTILQDLGDWEGTRTTLEALGPLDGLVNNAGIVKGHGKAMDMSKEVIDAEMSINLFAVINCIQVIAKTMIEAGTKGSIVNISSIGAMIAMPNFLSYCVGKAGVDMVTKQFALELGPKNIRVNSVNPTVVNTNLLSADVKDSGVGNVTERMPISRQVSVDEVVGPVLYMLSDYSAMVTGTTHLVDGGLACNITTKT